MCSHGGGSWLWTENEWAVKGCAQRHMEGGGFTLRGTGLDLTPKSSSFDECEHRRALLGHGSPMVPESAWKGCLGHGSCVVGHGTDKVGKQSYQRAPTRKCAAVVVVTINFKTKTWMHTTQSWKAARWSSLASFKLKTIYIAIKRTSTSGASCSILTVCKPTRLQYRAENSPLARTLRFELSLHLDLERVEFLLSYAHRMNNNRATWKCQMLKMKICPTGCGINLQKKKGSDRTVWQGKK